MHATFPAYLILLNLISLIILEPIPVTALSEVLVFGRSLAEIAG